ncbi:hypothetical protein RB195_017290 [Necator americanus]|uniref:Uncharacterized protein n=1 Tax=Necator americanus TaxID=51031 RepID=A0ABR1C6J6_NECAM
MITELSCLQRYAPTHCFDYTICGASMIARSELTHRFLCCRGLIRLLYSTTGGKSGLQVGRNLSRIDSRTFKMVGSGQDGGKASPKPLSASELTFELPHRCFLYKSREIFFTT